ncbi:MAG TPA: sigma-54 dependent transcriptional regulator [bacterium]|jgi:DNA-binding NtrC family response regulator|nr:sigma-54 dependent transcriptional regulator [bacterium]
MAEERAKVLVVEDEEGLRELLKASLGRLGHQVRACGSAEDALACLASYDPDVVLTDLRLPGMSGEDLLRRLKRLKPLLPVVVLSGFGKAKDIVEVIRAGAEDYLSKPVEASDLQVVLLKALEKQRLLKENERLRKELSGLSMSGLNGRSKPMRELFNLVERLAPSDATVLVQGESGVGKEVVARALHALSHRSAGPFVDINAGSVPATLFEAELFGAKKGAFTGADLTRDGSFQAAQGGTLFLDEVGEVPLESQAKLLRVLENHEVKMLGEARAKRVDVRVVAATNRDLEAEVRAGRFRRDLFFRLSVLPIRVPPLRERMEDIPLLVEALLQRLSPSSRLSAAALKRLLAHPWPGNVRELRNVLERAVLLAKGDEVGPADLYLDSSGSVPLRAGPFMQAKRGVVEAFEKDFVRRTLDESLGNVSHAARAAGMDRKNFQMLMKKHGLKAGQAPDAR